MAKKSKIFVLDTNVILHDHKCIYNFENNDVVLPIVVLEELDKFKKGNDPINYQAREFVRNLNNISGKKLFTEGISLGDKQGKLFICTGKPFTEIMRNSFSEKSPDHRILAIALAIKEKFNDRIVVLVSKDVNLRMKAKSLDLLSEDYESDKVKDLDVLEKDIQEYNDFDTQIISDIYNTNGINTDDFPIKNLNANQYLILKNGTQSVLAYYDTRDNMIKRVDKENCFGIDARNAEQTFSLHALTNPNVKLVSLTGKAGTGKTLLALAAALQQNKKYKNILLARPIVPLANRDLGFLPGDVKDKIGPYMQPLFDNLSVIKNNHGRNSRENNLIDELQRNDQLSITPLAYIRGRSLSDVYFIIDEAQNLTPHEVKTIITRAGVGTKMVFTGDIEQIDSPYLDKRSNGLAYLTEKMKDQEVFAHINLTKGERSFLAELASDLL